jgi:hypothetical protein
VQRLRHQLREYFPAALEAFEDLAAPDALELLARRLTRAAKLTRAQVAGAFRRARRATWRTRTRTLLAARHRPPCPSWSAALSWVRSQRISAAMKSSISPSSTAAVLLVSSPVRTSLTFW